MQQEQQTIVSPASLFSLDDIKTEILKLRDQCLELQKDSYNISPMNYGIKNQLDDSVQLIKRYKIDESKAFSEQDTELLQQLKTRCQLSIPEQQQIDILITNIQQRIDTDTKLIENKNRLTLELQNHQNENIKKLQQHGDINHCDNMIRLCKQQILPMLKTKKDISNLRIE